MKNLGIIAGEDFLPYELASLYQKNGGKCFIACLCPNNYKIFKKDFTVSLFKIGQVGAIIDFFKNAKITNILLIGNVKRVSFEKIKVDMGGAKLLAKITKNKFFGDDSLLRVVISYIEDNGFKVVSTYEILSLNQNLGDLNNIRAVSKNTMQDIELGNNILSTLSPFDIGQSTIIHKGYVLGIEGAEGTDELIKRCALLRKDKKGGILIKMPKKGQDLRVDLPTIGPGTIKLLKDNHYDGLAIDEKNILVVKQDELVKMVKDSSLFIKLI